MLRAAIGWCPPPLLLVYRIEGTGSVENRLVVGRDFFASLEYIAAAKVAAVEGRKLGVHVDLIQLPGADVAHDPAPPHGWPRLAPTTTTTASLAFTMGTSVAQIDATYGHLLPDSEAYLRGLLDAFDDVYGLSAAEAGSLRLRNPCSLGECG
jgi:hypothetical protein